MRPTTGGSLAHEDSYTERRKLFRNIWESAVNMNEKEEKPRLIRTLRLDSADKARKSTARKKEKLKNLRHVCNKILDFCDKQEAEEFIFEDKVLGEPAKEHNMEKVRCARKTLRKRHLYTPLSPTKIRYKHPSPPPAFGDHKYSRRRVSPSPVKTKSSSRQKYPSKKNSDGQSTTPINSLRQSATATNRKFKVHKRKKVKKNKT